MTRVKSYKDFINKDLNESTKDKQVAKFWSSGGKSTTISKTGGKYGNQILVIVKDKAIITKKYKYSLIVNGLFGSKDNLNFKNLIQNKDGGEVTIHRWVDGGTKERIIEVEDMIEIISLLKKGENASVSGYGISIDFKKIRTT